MAAAPPQHRVLTGTRLPLPLNKRRRNINAFRLAISASAARSDSRPLRAAVIGGGPAGASAAEALASGGVETYLLERSPSGSKPCGGAIPLCMLEEFSIPGELIDRRVTQMRIISPSNLSADFGASLRPGEHIPMLRREVLDSFLRRRAESKGARIIPALFTSLQIPDSSTDDPYIVRYAAGGAFHSLTVDVVVGADGANSRVAKAIEAGPCAAAMAFQERIRLPEEKMEGYAELAEMYVGGDVSPDFYGWVFPKCDHVAVGTGTLAARGEIKRWQAGIRARAGRKIEGGEVMRVEAHPIPEHPRARRVRGRVALVGDAAGYVTKCAGEGIYFAAKSGRMCGEGIVRVWRKGAGVVTEEGLKREYLGKWDGEYVRMFRFLDLLQSVFYGSNAGREALVDLCGDDYVQRMTFDSYFYKKIAAGNPIMDLALLWKTIGSLMRAQVLGRQAHRLTEMLPRV